jgi:hypothetical protein
MNRSGSCCLVTPMSPDEPQAAKQLFGQFQSFKMSGVSLATHLIAKSFRSRQPSCFGSPKILLQK